MDQSVTILDRIIKNINSVFINTTITSINKILQVTVLLYFFDNASYSLWIVILSFAAIFTFSDFGISSYSGNLFLKYIKRDNNKSFYKFYQFSNKLVIYLCSIIFLFFLLAIFIFNFSKIFYSKLDELYIEGMLTIFIVSMLVQIISQFYFQVLKSVDLISWAVNNASKILVFQIPLLFIVNYLFENILISAFFFNIPYLIIFFIFKFKVNKIIKQKKYSQLSNKFIKNKKLIKNFLFGSSSFLFFNVNYTILNFIPIYVLTKFDKEFLVSFYLYKNISMFLLQIFNIFSNSFAPEINKTYFSNNIYYFLQQFRFLIFISIFIIIFSYLLFNFFGLRIFDLWTNGEILFDFEIFKIFIIFSFIRILWVLSSVILQSINKLILFGNLFSLFNLTYLIIFFYFYQSWELNFVHLLYFEILLLFIGIYNLLKIKKISMKIEIFLVLLFLFCLYLFI